MAKITKIVVFSITITLTIVLGAIAGPLPDTGQTGNYTATFGEDSDYNINPQSYTKLDASGNDLPDGASSWVMVRDNVTGLIWEVKQNKDSTPDYSNPHDADNQYTWYDSNPETNGGDAGTPGDGTDTEDFITALNANSFGGFTDWRLPTIKELAYILKSIYIEYTPAINTDYFPNTPWGTAFKNYWASTTRADYTAGAWRVDFVNANVTNSTKASWCYVRAVRGGQSESFENLVNNGDGTITDISTGLMWEQKTDDGSANDKDNTYKWDDALFWAENLNTLNGVGYLGYSDWRLPNRNELQSLADYSTDNPAINTTYFPNTVSPYPFWSSTTKKSNSPSNSQANYVDFSKSSVSYATKINYYYKVRAVRGGQHRFSDHLVILTPVQGSAWSPGSVKEITWDTKGIPGNVKITLSRQGGKDGTFIETIAESTENDGAYFWTVTGPNSFNCMLKIEPLETGYEDKGTIQGLFTIDNPTMLVDPPSHSFGDAAIGEACPAQTFTITNTGSGELEINSIVISGQDSSDFLIASDDCTGQGVQPSYSCMFTVEFCPISTGQKNAKLTISTNDPTEPFVEISVTGLGIDVEMTQYLLQAAEVLDLEFQIPLLPVRGVIHQA